MGLSRIPLAIACITPLICAAQEAREYNLRSDATLVQIPVSVTDPQSRFVLGLEKRDFHVLEDGKEQKITHFSGEDAPLSIGLLLDTSGSMGFKLEKSRQAVAEFMKTMNAQDEAFLLEFNESAAVTQPFTSDMEEIRGKLNVLESKGLTALLDALHMALAEMKKARNPRKAILVVSDGGENNSKLKLEDVTSVVREADVQIYCIGVFETSLASLGLSMEERTGPGMLAKIADQTGGRVYPARRFADLPALAAKVGIELRNQYVLGYSPSNGSRDGKYRKVQVNLAAPAGLPPLKAFWRTGYYAPGQ
jgi:VWFA-related protein